MADNLEVRGLELKIQTTSSNATQSLEKLSSAIKGLQYTKGRAANLEKMSQELVRFSNTLKGVDTSSIEKLSAFAPALNSLSGIKKPSIPTDLGERLGAVAEVLGKTDTEKLTEQTKQFATALQPLSELKMRSPNMSAFADNLNKIDMQKLAVQSRLAATAMQPLVATMARLADSFKSIPSNLMIGALVGVSKNSATATPQVNRFNGALKALEKTWRSLGALARGANYVLPFRGLGSTIGGAKKKMDNLFSSLKRIALYRAIRTFIKNITEGFKIGTQNLYYYSQAVGTKFAPAMELLATDLLYLRNSIGAAASPLIEKLAPAVDYATDRIVDMINVVNQLMAKLTGKSQWTKALKYPAEYAEATKNSAKAAKDYLLEFDELHVLDDNSGGRGADALDYSRMFEEQDLDKSFASWVDDFKDAIRNGDWAGAGGVLGEQLNKVIMSVDSQKLGKDIFTKVNDAIYFSQGFLDHLDTQGWGKGLAKFLNSSINTLDTKALGTVMGTRVQKIIDFAFGFVTTFNWVGAGEALTDLLKGWFEAIDGKKLGETVSATITGALSFIKTIADDKELRDDIGDDIVGFLNGLDWYNIIYGALSTAGSIALAIFDILHKIITETDWVALGTGIYNGLKDALISIDWEELLSDISGIIYAIFENAALIANEILKDAGNDLGAAFSIAIYGGYFDESTGEWIDIKKQHMAMAEEIAEGVTGIFGGSWLNLNPFNQYEQVAATMPFNPNNGSNYSALLGQIGSQTTGIPLVPEDAENFGRIVGFVFDRITSRFGPVAEVMGNLKENMDDIVDYNTTMLGDVIPGYGGAQTHVLQSLFGNNGILVKGGRNIKTASKSWKDYATALDDATNGSKNLSAETGALDTAVTTMSEDIVSPLTNFKNTFNGAKDSASRAINDTKTNFVNGVNGMNTALVTPLSTLKSSVTGTFKDIKKGAVGAIKDTNTELTTPLDKVKNKIVTAFKNTNTELNTPITNIRKRGTNAINGTITDIATPLTNLKNKIVNSYKDTNKDLNAPVSAIRKQAPDAINNSTNDLTSPLSTFKDAMVNGFMDIPKMLRDQDFVGNATGLWRDVKNNIIPIGNSILTAGELIANGINAAFTNLSNKIGGYTLSLPKEFGGGTIRFNFPKSSDITVPRIPAMAQGGLVTSPTTALIGEAGREAVMPLDNNTEWMDMLASRLVVGMSGATMYDNNDRPIQVHVTLDGREIYQNQEKVRRSIGYNVGGGAFA